MILEWKQTSWPTRSSSTGSGCVFPTECGPSSSPGCSRFEGIAVSHSQKSVLDGNGNSSCRYHAIGASSECKGGFPGRNSQVAYSMKFFIRTTETPTPMPTPPRPPTPAPSPEPTYLDSAGDSFTCDLIAKQIGGTLFDSEAKHTCLMNADGASSETYMKLGTLVSSSEAFMDNGKCCFSLVYDDTMIR